MATELLQFPDEKYIHWHNFVRNHSSYDGKQAAKFAKLSYRARQKLFTKCLKSPNDANEWKLIHLLDIAHRQHEPNYKDDGWVNLFRGRYKNLRQAFCDYSLADKERVNFWLGRYLYYSSITTEMLEHYIELGADSCDGGLYRVISRGEFEQLEFLKNRALFSDQELLRVIRKVADVPNLIPAHQAMKYLPEEMRFDLPGFKPHKTVTDTETGWKKLESHIISMTQALPDNLICQDVFNFEIEEVRSITRDTETGNIAQTIRRFDELSPAFLKAAAKILRDQGGDPDPHHRGIKKHNVAPLPVRSLSSQ